MVRKPYVAPRLVLAANLRALLDAAKLSAPELAQKAGVDRKTLNNMLNARFDPRPQKVDDVARVFGLSGWQLLRPGITKDPATAEQLERLIERFSSADAAGRDTIMRVAEMTGPYKAK